jgi:uncharacterized protein (TIGR03435 family)
MRATCLAILVLGIVSLVHGQQMVFDVASIAPSSPSASGIRGGTRGRTYTAVNMPLRRIVAAAYELQLEDFRLIGNQPLLSNRFDITATLPETATPRDVPAMLRAVLAERFNLRVHTETREAPALTLTVARRDGRLGPKLSRAVEGAPPESEIGDSIKGRGQPLSSLARMLTMFMERRVLDRTGLTGAYDFDLQFDAATTGPGVDSTSALVTALQEQLGLKLESAVAPIEFIVIDRVEAPTPN